MRRNLHRPLIVGVGAVLLAATACTTSSETTPATASTTTAVTTPPGPGSPIDDGLVVPEGAEMVGSLFAMATYTETGERAASPGAWLAHLVVDGDGFAVYDDLAAQIRDLDPSAAMPGTADSCIWSLEETSVVDDPHDLLVRDPTPEGIRGVRCEGRASDEAGRSYELSLVAGFDQPAVVEVSATPVPAGPSEPDSYAKRIVAEGSGADAAGLEVLSDAAVAVDAWADAELDIATMPEPPSAGPFGIAANCTTSGQFTVPDDAQVLIDLYGDDLTSLLAVDDAEATMADLLSQTGQDQASLQSGISTVPLADGRAFLVLDTQVLAGGGSCTVTSSPDGHSIRIDRFPD